MTLREARKQLEALGFTFPKVNKCLDGTIRWGYKNPEPYQVGKDHFVARNRDVFIGKCKGGVYITSSIHGKMRQYRCRRWYDTDILNIFGGGATLQMAVNRFVVNFNTRTYNKAI